MQIQWENFSGCVKSKFFRCRSFGTRPLGIQDAICLEIQKILLNTAVDWAPGSIKRNVALHLHKVLYAKWT